MRSEQFIRKCATNYVNNFEFHVDPRKKQIRIQALVDFWMKPENIQCHPNLCSTQMGMLKMSSQHS